MTRSADDLKNVRRVPEDVNDSPGFNRHRARHRLAFHAGRGARGKDQRFDHHRDGAGHAADVDVIELLEFEPVDRDDRVRRR
jgi:hypothetical protein